MGFTFTSHFLTFTCPSLAAFSLLGTTGRSFFWRRENFFLSPLLLRIFRAALYDYFTLLSLSLSLTTLTTQASLLLFYSFLAEKGDRVITTEDSKENS
jgi:hypothetical protein